MIAWDVLNYQTLSVIFCSACPQRGGGRGEGEGEGKGRGGGGETKRKLHGPDSLSNSKHVGHREITSVQNGTFFYKNIEVRKERNRQRLLYTDHTLLRDFGFDFYISILYITIFFKQNLSKLGICTANEGPVKIQYKCLVPIYVFPEMKLRGLVIPEAEL